MTQPMYTISATFKNLAQNDDRVCAQVEAIDLSGDLLGMGLDKTPPLGSDSTVVTAPGVITRTIIVQVIAGSLIDSQPNAADQIATLKDVVTNCVCQRVPCESLIPEIDVAYNPSS